MVTDLERNDLGKVCEFGSVQVKEMRAIEEYKTVFQATSTIEGRLRKDRNCFDLIEYRFTKSEIRNEVPIHNIKMKPKILNSIKALNICTHFKKATRK
mgnify:CR=1 FL=1